MADQSPVKPLWHQPDNDAAPLSARELDYAVGDNSELNLVEPTEPAPEVLPGEESDNSAMDDDDSAIDIGSYRSSTLSIRSSAAERLEENGRTYHAYKDGKYMLPNDEAELNRLDIQHRMWEITLDNKLHLAPIGPSPYRVLDFATGSGIWAVDFANTYSSAMVTGTDLSAVQPDFIPPNCEFQIDDAEDEWLFSHPFDYIHGRACATCFKDPKDVFRKAYDALKPGGYFEMQDLSLQTSDDGSMEHTTLSMVIDHINDALGSTGMRWDNAAKYKRWMQELGFEDVTETRFRWPSNQHWPTDPKEKVLGAWFTAQIDQGLHESVCTRIFMTKLGWTREQLDELLVKMGRDSNDRKIRAYSPVHVVYGRKPPVTVGE